MRVWSRYNLPMDSPLHIERVLLVAGGRGSGKSTQLRAMFLDPRLGYDGQIPTIRRPRERYRLSPDRQLYVRFSSPHESNATLEEFLNKIETKSVSGRWCFAGAVQIESTNRVPDLRDVVDAIVQRFSPERIRIALLSPDRRGRQLADANDHLENLREAAPVVEVMSIDARTREGNGLLLADTFDFA